MRQAIHHDVQTLLQREARASLPFRRLLLLYLNPFALFKDASVGPPGVRERARSYNRAMRWMLLSYLQRWLMIAASSFLGIAPAEALATEVSVFIIPAAAFAVGCCVAIAVIVCTVTAYFLLGR